MGLIMEAPIITLVEFEEVVATMVSQAGKMESTRLRLFPFSVRDKATTWLNSFKPQSVRTWADLQREFFKFFPIHRTRFLIEQIQSFRPRSVAQKRWENQLSYDFDFLHVQLPRKL